MPRSAQSLSRRRIVRSEHPAVAIRSYPLPCTNAATTCSNTTRSGTRRRWQPSGWPGSNGGRSAPSSARNSTQIGSSRHDGTAGTGHLGDHWTLDKPMIINPVPVPCNDTHGSPLLPGVLSRWVSLLLAALALFTLAAGLGYATGLVRSIAGKPGLWVHIAVALTLVPLVVWHVWARGIRSRRTDLS